MSLIRNLIQQAVEIALNKSLAAAFHFRSRRDNNTLADKIDRLLDSRMDSFQTPQTGPEDPSQQETATDPGHDSGRSRRYCLSSRLDAPSEVFYWILRGKVSSALKVRRSTLMRLIKSLIAIGMVSALIGSQAIAETPSPSAPSPIEVRLSQVPDPVPLWLKLTDTLAWPLIALIAVLLFRKALVGVANSLIAKGGEISVGTVAVKLLESKVDAQKETISSQQGRIDEQNERIRNLIRFTMSGYIFSMLFEIRKAQRAGGQYIYRNDGSMDRNLRFLIDHGYVEEVPHWPQDGENLCPLVKITPSGEDLIAMRAS